MIAGVGVDLVNIRRMEKWQKVPGLPERFFDPEELSAALARGASAASSLAARFAAKEAFVKALGSGFEGIALKDIMVKNKPSGQPELILFGTAFKALENSGAKSAHISLSHERDYAIAMVVLET